MSNHDQVKISKKSSESTSCCSDGDYYPYGTSINLENDLVDNLNVDNLAVGDIVEIKGYAFVDSKSEHSDKDSTNKSVRLQMTSIKVERETDDVIKQMYGE